MEGENLLVGVVGDDYASQGLQDPVEQLDALLGIVRVFFYGALQPERSRNAHTLRMGKACAPQHVHGKLCLFLVFLLQLLQCADDVVDLRAHAFSLLV